MVADVKPPFGSLGKPGSRHTQLRGKARRHRVKYGATSCTRMFSRHSLRQAVVSGSIAKTGFVRSPAGFARHSAGFARRCRRFVRSRIAQNV